MGGASTLTTGRDRPRHRPHVSADVLGVMWVLAAGLAVLAPTLVHGAGIFDIANAGDQVDSTIPWTMLAWRQVHHGLLPLWNPYSALGMPLTFNWHSQTLSPVALVGYLFPMGTDFTVQVILTLAIAGIGIYVLGRLLGLHPLSCVFAAIAFELSGPFMGWLGLPIAAVMAWAPWLFAAALLVLRGTHRVRHIALLAVVMAFTIYSGQPPLLGQLGLFLVLFLAIALVPRCTERSTRRDALRSVVDLVLGATAGIALAAPLVLPGLQLVQHAVKGAAVSTSHVFVSPVGGVFYEATNDTYLGALCLVLAAVGLYWGRHRAEVLGFGAISLIAALASFCPPVVAFMRHLPVIGVADFSRATLNLALGAAMLAGFGVEAMLQRKMRESAGSWRRSLEAWGAAGCGLLGLGVLAMFLAGSTRINAVDQAVRDKSLLWRAVEAGAGVAVLGALLVAGQRGRHSRGMTLSPTARGGRVRAVGVSTLIAVETAFLVVAGQPQWLSPHTSQVPYGPGPLTTAIQTSVGHSFVGFGDNRHCYPGSLGILQDINVNYQIHELAVYDAILPEAYLTAWKAQTGSSPAISAFIYCPAVTSAAIARLYGVQYVLEPRGSPGPVGGVLDGYAGFSRRYRIPGAYPAEFIPWSSATTLPTLEATGSGVPVSYPNDASWRVVTNSPRPGVLRIHLTDVPGWHATIDGRSLALQRYAGIMLQGRIPPGPHIIVLRYWPSAFTDGLILALCSGVCLAVALAWSARHRRVLDRRQPRAVVVRQAARTRSGPTTDKA